VLTDNETANPEFVQNTMKPLIRDMLAPSSRQEGVSCFCMYSVSRQEANHARRVAGLCGTLRRSCCEYGDGPIAFRKAGGIKALVNILRTFASDPGVVEPACALAGAVCGPNAINARTFAREDGMTELLKALAAYPQSVTVTASAFTAIAAILAAGGCAASAQCARCEELFLDRSHEILCARTSSAARPTVCAVDLTKCLSVSAACLSFSLQAACARVQTSAPSTATRRCWAR
jgi:hypothetical protein